MSATEVYREVWRITERRGGAVYKTEKVTEGWYDLDESNTGRPNNDPDLLWSHSNRTISIRRKPACEFCGIRHTTNQECNQ